jgi:hypothetical protein
MTSLAPPIVRWDEAYARRERDAANTQATIQLTLIDKANA